MLGALSSIERTAKNCAFLPPLMSNIRFFATDSITMHILPTLNFGYLLIFLALLIPTPIVWGQAGSDLWTQTVKAIGFAATTKAGIRVGCALGSPLSSNASYIVLCPKLDAIPNSVIESAALPYLKQYLTEDSARQATAFWSSDRGRKLTSKIVREIETGVYNQLNADDLKLLNSANQSEFGRTLKSFAMDKEQGRAVIRAMLDYEP